MKQIRQIIQGWVFYLLKLYSRRFLERYKICIDCTHNVDSVCNLCGCPLQKKLRVKDAECDDQRW